MNNHVQGGYSIDAWDNVWMDYSGAWVRESHSTPQTSKVNAVNSLPASWKTPMEPENHTWCAEDGQWSCNGQCSGPY